MQSGVLAIDTFSGSGNLSYTLTQTREAMCVAHCLMDNDLSGQSAVNRALKDSMLTLSDLTYTSCLGMRESELEDWYDASIIAPTLIQHFGVPASSPYYTGVKKKVKPTKGLLICDGCAITLMWLAGALAAVQPGCTSNGAR